MNDDWSGDVGDEYGGDDEAGEFESSDDGSEFGVGGGGEDEPGARAVAREEREAMYPMTGYVLVRVDYEEPPGEALTEVAHYGSLSSVDLPEAGPMTTYVVYDGDGNAYDREAVEDASGR